MNMVNIRRKARVLAQATAIAAAFAFASPVVAANYPLELVSPRAAGSFPSSDGGTPAIPSGHRIFKAYPGIPYNIKAVVIAGEFPYRFQLANAPNGMTINADTGEITWPNPQANATPTITVTDADGTERSSSWAIVVSTSGIRFVDSVRGSDSNPGTISAPWATLLKSIASGSPGDLVYFRAGIYRADGSHEFEIEGSSQPTRFLAYPGETPVYDGGYVPGVSEGTTLRISASSANPVYIEGFSMRNIYHMGIQFFSGTCDYPVFRNLAFNGPAVGIDGSNSAGIMTTNNLSDPTYYGAYQGLSQVNGGPGLIKQYSHKKNLWENFTIVASKLGPDQKMHVPRFEIRQCTITSNTDDWQGGIFGNMQFGSGGVGETSSGEVRFNLVDRRNVSADTMALDLNQNDDSGIMNVYRNTFLGRVRVRNADTADGPFRFYDNVIVNNDAGTPSGSHIYLDNVAAPARITATDNLTGYPSANIVNSAGLLTGNYAQYLGTRGHQVGPAGARPSPPDNLIVE